MCFSAAASFTAAGVLGAAGVATLRHAKDPSMKPYAAIPLLFAAQQLVEGVVWLSFGAPRFLGGVSSLYLLFSHVLWPAFIPFAMWKLETGARRKQALRYLFFLGSGISLYLLSFILTGPVVTVNSGRGIIYDVPMPSIPFGIVPYILATCLPCFISSHKYVRVLGISIFGSLIIAYWFYERALYSTWCFFAAILSLIIYVHLRTEHADKKTAR